MQLASSAFRDGERIPLAHVMTAAGGKNLSVPLSWTNAPGGTKSFALACVDAHPVAQNWVHWIAVNLPASTTALGEGVSGRQMPAGAVEARNSFGFAGYGGPQPPKGTGDHVYIFALYALSVDRVELPAAPTAALFRKALEGKILAVATWRGTFSR
jgi:hypothetical protein